jgi:DNA polymerase-3 subunit delta
MASPTKTIYLFHGQDDVALEEAVSKLRAGMGEYGDMNTSQFDGESGSISEMINAAASYPFLSDRRLVLVRGLASHLTRKGGGDTAKRAIEQLLEEAPTLPEHARLVLMERGALPDNHKLIKGLSEMPNAYVKAFNVPADLAQWIHKRAEAYAITFDGSAARILADMVGGDLRRLDGEISKLADYAMPRTEISEEDVAALTPYVPEGNIFKLVDAISGGDGKVALSVFHTLLLDKANTPFSVFGMITRQFRLLILAREFIEQGGHGSAAQTLGVNPRASEGFIRQARQFSMDDLEAIHRQLLETDTAMKTGLMEPQLALDLFIAGLSD